MLVSLYFYSISLVLSLISYFHWSLYSLFGCLSSSFFSNSSLFYGHNRYYFLCFLSTTQNPNNSHTSHSFFYAPFSPDFTSQPVLIFRPLHHFLPTVPGFCPPTFNSAKYHCSLSPSCLCPPPSTFPSFPPCFYEL